MKKLQNKKGFTMAELLIVVAIIAVLVAISIPIFTSRLESSRQATDIANLRNAYAEVNAYYLTDNSTSTIPVTMKHQKDWTSANKALSIGDNSIASISSSNGSQVNVSIDASGVTTIN